jgi:hypothetical protein
MAHPRILDEEEARQFLAKECAKRPSVAAWCNDNGQLPSFVSEMISGRKPISKRVCAILGLRKVTRFEVDEHAKLR